MNKQRISVIIIIAISTFLFSCSGLFKHRTDNNQNTLKIAKALQAMTEGAELGSLFESRTQYSEREPNANAYLGHLIYNRYCQQCHGNASTTNLNERRMSSLDSESDYYIIRYGIKSPQGDMTGFRNRLTQYQILDVMAFLRHDPHALAAMIKELNEYSLEGVTTKNSTVERQSETKSATKSE